MDYVATRKLALMGQIYAPGDVVPSEGLDPELEVIYLSRAFLVPLGGLWEDLDDDLYLAVMEARD